MAQAARPAAAPRQGANQRFRRGGRGPLRRPPRVKVVADVSPDALQLHLDAFAVRAATTDLHWESAGLASGDHSGSA